MLPAHSYTELVQSRQVFLFIEHKSGQAHEVLRFATGLLEEVRDIAQGLFHLIDEVRRFKNLIFVPADLTAEIDDFALLSRERLGNDAFNQRLPGATLTATTSPECQMITALILINTERTKIKEVAEKLADIDAISEVYSVSGHYDLVAMVRVKTNDELADLATEGLADVGGIEHTETMLAFRVYSRHDLEAMFSL
ncbi:MAG: hypothetical protein MAG794_00541 [Gammaproteobacteria bacterium]|nr:hypothetical protein [Gammaproteobacteria bacterium]